MNSYFAKNLKILRRHYKLSQGELANQLAIGRNKIASYEGRSIEPKLSLLINMSIFFKVTIDDLVAFDISEHNLDDILNRYEQKKTIPDVSFSVGEEVIPKNLFQEFSSKTDSVVKMADGFRAYSSLYNEEEVRHPSTITANNILKVLEHLLEINKKIISAQNEEK